MQTIMLSIKQCFFIVSLFFALSASALAEPVWIDVRSDKEHAETHIEGDLHIPHGKIAEQIGQHVTDKNTEIHLYCRSGRRAGIAREALIEAGYSNVINAGGISDARKSRNIDDDK